MNQEHDSESGRTPEQVSPEQLTTRYAQALEYWRELQALPLNHGRQPELLYHALPDVAVLLQIPYGDNFPNWEQIQTEMLALLSIDELSELTQYLYGQLLGSRFVIGAIDRFIERYPASEETDPIRQLTKTVRNL
jgi:hypothetical protein